MLRFFLLNIPTKEVLALSSKSSEIIVIHHLFTVLSLIWGPDNNNHSFSQQSHICLVILTLYNPPTIQVDEFQLQPQLKLKPQPQGVPKLDTRFLFANF